MIPQNENDAPVVLKEQSWLDRMHQKLETFYDGEAGRNSSEMLQETGTFFENQISTLGTNVKKFCSEFVQDLLITPPDSDAKSELSKSANPQSQSASQIRAGVEEAMKLVDKPMFHLEGSSAAVMPAFAPLKVVHTPKLQAEAETQNNVGDRVDEPPITPLTEASNSSVSEDSQASGSEQSEPMGSSSSSSNSKEGEAEQYAQWYVSEEYRRMRLGRSSSTSSIESCDGRQRAGSRESLQDWELI